MTIDVKAEADKIKSQKDVSDLNERLKMEGYPRYGYDIFIHIWDSGPEGKKLLLCEAGCELSSSYVWMFPDIITQMRREYQAGKWKTKEDNDA